MAAEKYTSMTRYIRDGNETVNFASARKTLAACVVLQDSPAHLPFSSSGSACKTAKYSRPSPRYTLFIVYAWIPGWLRFEAGNTGKSETLMPTQAQ